MRGGLAAFRNDSKTGSVLVRPLLSYQRLVIISPHPCHGDEVWHTRREPGVAIVIVPVLPPMVSGRLRKRAAVPLLQLP